MTALNPTRADLLRMFALDVPFTRGSGVHLYDEGGKEYLDFLSQYGAVPFGHNVPELWAALDAARQGQMPSMIQPLRALEAERLAERLADLTPGDLGIVTLTNSGAETVETAIKLARLKTGRKGILSTHNGFHGKTLAALSATGKPAYQEGFFAPAEGFGYVRYGDLDALRNRLRAEGGEIAAFIVEPIQGEGGVICPPANYIDAAIALCREHGVLVILDEIQTGLGRTGKLFACSGGVEVPDMLLLSKALGGGMMPIGACIARPSAWDDSFGQKHSSTFANNNLAATVANAVLDKLLADDRALIRDVARHGDYLGARLDALKARFPDVVRDVRGRGFMRGLEFHRFDERTESATMAYSSLNGGAVPLISSYLFNVHGLITAPLFNESHVMRLQPALVCGPAEIDRAMDAITEACAILSARDYYRLVRHLVAKPSTRRPEQVVVDAQKPGPAPALLPAAECGEFGFVIHYTGEEDILKSDPSFAQFTKEELSAWREWARQLGAGFVRRLPEITSKAGAKAQGWLLSVPMLPEDMKGSGKFVAGNAVRDAIDMAAQRGSSRIGLGAFTSIVTRGGETATGRGPAITSGNTLTTVAAVQSIEAVAEQTNLPLDFANVVVVGASGAIGRLAALMLARRAGKLSLVGNADNPFTPRLLQNVADDIYGMLVIPGDRFPGCPGQLALETWQVADRQGLPGVAANKGLAETFDAAFRREGREPLVQVNVPLAEALADADVVLVATSSDMKLVDPRKLNPGTLVCDVARPPNVQHVADLGAEVLVFDGGLVKPPFPVDLGAFQTLPKDICWGCLGETMLLTLARETADYSIGARLPLAGADRLAELAKIHGFEPAPLRWSGELVDASRLESFSYHVARKFVAKLEPLVDAMNDGKLPAASKRTQAPQSLKH